MTLPEPTARPCNECPWRRESVSGWLGPFDADEWLALVHSDEPIACHKTIENDGEWTGSIRQCAGAGQFRTNVHKSPRNREVYRADEPDDTVVFGRSDEFRNHHEGERA